MSKGKGGGGASGNINPFDLANAQTQSNIKTAQTQAALNNSNVSSPVGSSVWTPYTDAQGNTRYQLTTALSPALAGVWNPQVSGATTLAGTIGNLATQGANTVAGANPFFGMAGQALSGVNPQLNLTGVPSPQQVTTANFQTSVPQGPIQTSVAPAGPIQTSVNSNFPQLVKQAQDAAYQSQTQYLDPQFAQQKSNLDQQLADQGIQPGTAAYDRAVGDFNRAKQMAYQSAQSSAVAAGNAQEQSLFGQSVAAGQFANTAQGQQFGQNVTAGQFGNQAQQQGFTQGVSLADLYNQAELASLNQGNIASQYGLSRAQAVANQPLATIGALVGAGGGITSSGLAPLQTAGGLVNVAPTWPASTIPTMGGYNYPVTATNYPQAVQAAANSATAASNIGTTSLANLTTLGNLTGLTGTGGGIFGSGGLLGGPFNALATGLGTGYLGGGYSALSGITPSIYSSIAGSGSLDAAAAAGADAWLPSVAAAGLI